MAWIADRCAGSATGHAVWLAGAAVLGFLVPYAAVAVALLDRDAFVLVHALASGGYIAWYARWAGFPAAELRLNWPLGLGLGALAAAFAVEFVLSQPASPAPDGLAGAFALIWLGLVYALIDTALLTILPVYAVWCIARRRDWLRRRPGRLGTAAVCLGASLLLTLAYHLGFPEFQGPEVVRPLIGNAVFTLAYILSASPLAPIIAHAALHIAAVLHAHATSIPLPPHY